MQNGKILVNIDETNIDFTDFRRRHWVKKGAKSTASAKTVSPRISMFAAVFSDGELLTSLSQANTDKHTKSLFLSYLVQELDESRPGWRSNHVFFFDGASYNTCQWTKDHLKRLKVPYMTTGPYSYDGCCVERFFAHFKMGDLNPDNLATGKKQVE
jgi:hypothetical protein